MTPDYDPVRNPHHYVVPVEVQLADGDTDIVIVECRKAMEALGLNSDFDISTAFAYLWRCMRKHEDPKEDIAKAHTHLTFWLERRALQAGSKE